MGIETLLNYMVDKTLPLMAQTLKIKSNKFLKPVYSTT